MSIERERYEQMMARQPTIWGRIKALFVFPPLPRQEEAAASPRGGPIETPAPPLALSIAPSLDAVPDRVEKPLVGYLSKAGHRIFSEEPSWWTALYRDPADLNAKGAIVEVEIRVLRVIPEGAR